MHLKHSDHVHAPPTVPVKLILQDPKSLTGKEDREISLICSKGASILEEALEHGINIEHACGGVCACSTCHVYIQEGEDSLKEAEDDELDRVEEAPGLQRNSRLSCQCVITGDGPVVVEVPAWNRNAVKEVPH
jgi:2Fe-2S ferredoxin